MFGLILIYFIGKQFFTLAQMHNRSTWGFALLGVASYYAGTIIGAVLIVLFYEFFLDISSDSLSDTALGLMAIPFGLLACWGLHKVLEQQWKRKLEADNANVLDEDLLYNDRNQG
ncbi:MAG: hypothetical protein SH848_08330 [Saprospiraceae bacterium]|nr:hypothetical protein [Saprospiraceae bacterium]MDZ4703922.1 hypothetical protein [Saprospiraceae bacterium]